LTAPSIPDHKLLAEMRDCNEELVKASVMLAGEGLHPSRNGVSMAEAKGDAGR
jgi:hypothetical protein